MTFTETDQGPFYLNKLQQSETKHNLATIAKKKHNLKKSELINLLQSKIELTLPLSNGKTLVELQMTVATHGISIKIKEECHHPGKDEQTKVFTQDFLGARLN